MGGRGYQTGIIKSIRVENWISENEKKETAAAMKLPVMGLELTFRVSYHSWRCSPCLYFLSTDENSKWFRKKNYKNTK